MRIRLRPLLTIGFKHPYYTGLCEDFEFVSSEANAELLRSGRVMVRVDNGRLNLLYEIDDAGDPISSLAGQTLRFGLRLVNPWFDHFTQPVLTDRKLLPVYRNTADPLKLDAPVGVTLASAIRSHTPTSVVRPLTVRVTDEGGNVVDMVTLSNNEVTAQFQPRTWEDGDYVITEMGGNVPVATVPLFVSAELRSVGIWGLVAITIPANAYQSPVDYDIPFTPREEQLKYFVIGSEFPVTEFDTFKITDTRTVQEAGVLMVFEKVKPADYTADDIALSLLADSKQQVVLFQSQTLQVRRDRGVQKLQLSYSTMNVTTVLVENLPSPGPERASSQLIIYTAKPFLS